MTFGLLAPIANLNRAIRLVAVSSILGNVINDSLPRVDFKTNLGALRLAIASRNVIKDQDSESVPPEIVKISHEIEDRLDQIHDSVRKHEKLLLEEKASKRNDLPQLIQLQVVQQPPPANNVQFSSGNLHYQQQSQPHVQLQSQQLQIQPQQQQFQPSLPQFQAVPQQRPIVMRLLALNSASGQTNQNPSSSAILLFHNSNNQQQFNGQLISTSNQQFQSPTSGHAIEQLLQQMTSEQTASNQQPQVISMENLTAALTHASFGSPSIATGVISGQIVDPRTKEVKESSEDQKSEDESEHEENEEVKEEGKKRKKSKRGKSSKQE